MCYYCGCRPREISENEWKALAERLVKIEDRLDDIERGILGKSMDKLVKEKMEQAELRLGLLPTVRCWAESHGQIVNITWICPLRDPPHCHCGDETGNYGRHRIDCPTR